MGGSGSETTTAARRGLEGEREAGARARARVRRCWHVVGPGSHVRVVLLSQIGVRERACRCCKEGNSEGETPPLGHHPVARSMGTVTACRVRGKRHGKGEDSDAKAELTAQAFVAIVLFGSLSMGNTGKSSAALSHELPRGDRNLDKQ